MDYPVYLDYNATTPVDPQVLDTMLPYFTTHFGNAASRTHVYGLKAEDAVEAAREQVAELIGAMPKEIVFTSGATESINLAIKGFYEAAQHRGNHLITVVTEHKAVLDTCHHLEQLGAEVTYLLPDGDGLISRDQLEAAIKPTTILISVMLANNEIGVIQPIQELAALAQERGIAFHTDATQAIGKLPVNLRKLPVDLLSLSGHKLYGPKGVGALYIRKNIPLTAQQDGGRHERNRRSGTLNVPGIVGLGKAAALCDDLMTDEAQRLAGLRDQLETGILQQVPDTHVNGSRTQRLANTTNISFAGVDGEVLLMSLNRIAVSNGSACNSASTEPSYVLKALHLSDDLAYSSVRFSLGRFTTEADITPAIQHVTEVVARLRQEQ
ncbi:cysteine desulfurase family protein [Arsenicibacter rosenii]|uniref:cysteine desulfurase n=1 Tax=Arsenicibacter rosenii TaxID=1750698 RepID=A0A1S2VFL3_9BACT|nr:IscS subfamily cysteine desulfurase [Arsenicibacter rosenii]OIN57541.1 IscS subfamily cysteine desulfurase [Arsenicibacter rosenii]